METFDIFSQGRDLESCGDLSWRDLLDKPEDLSDRESEAWVNVPVVLDVIDVLVSLSSEVTEFCDVFPVARIGKLWNCSPFLSPKSVLIVVQ